MKTPFARRIRLARSVRLLFLGLPVLLALLPAALVGAQVETQAIAPQNLRPYWHVFAAYAVAWALVFGWLYSVARRLARVERSLEE